MDKDKKEDEKNQGKTDGFGKIVMELAMKIIPFTILKVCIPPIGLTTDCCPEAMVFPMQMSQVMQIDNKIPEFKLAAQSYPGWLAVNGKENIAEIPYYLCAQSYLSLYESKIFPRCNMLSLIIMHPLNMAGILPGDLPICFASCILGAATCQVMFDKFAPCDLFSPYMAIQSIMDLTLKLFIVNAFTDCTFIPFLVRWDIVPKWKKPSKFYCLV